MDAVTCLALMAVHNEADRFFPGEIGQSLWSASDLIDRWTYQYRDRIAVLATGIE